MKFMYVIKKLPPRKIFFIFILSIFSCAYANEFMKNIEEVRKNNDVEVKNLAKKIEQKNTLYRMGCAYDAGEAKSNYAAKKIEANCLKTYELK